MFAWRKPRFGGTGACDYGPGEELTGRRQLFRTHISSVSNNFKAKTQENTSENSPLRSMASNVTPSIPGAPPLLLAIW
jgi:hypothetical protein